MVEYLQFGNRKLSLEQPLIMGILNVTEDSFFDGGQYLTEDAVLNRVGKMLDEGADIIDLGAMSTRPGAAELPEEEELGKIAKAVRQIVSHYPEAVISVDTWRASVARAAVANGARMINDISGGTFDAAMIPAMGQLQVPYCLMHTTAKPDVMQQRTEYQDIIKDIFLFFETQIEKLTQQGLHRENIILDPGFGFGKTLEQNYFLLQNMQEFRVLDLPVLVGISRKSMIYKLLDCSPKEALNGTTVLNTLAVQRGANILRVHDVREAVEVRKICAQLAAR